MTLPAGYTSSQTIATLEGQLPLSGFKALVCLYFFGGIDGYQVLVPMAGNPNLAPYEQHRPVGVRMEQNEITPITGSNPPWGLNQNIPLFSAQAAAGKLAVVQEVGRLLGPTTKAQVLVNPRLKPAGVHGHNTGTDRWFMNWLGNTRSNTGWLGRAGNLINGYYNDRISSGSTWGVVSAAGNQIITRTFAPVLPVVLPVPVRNAYQSHDADGRSEAIAAEVARLGPLVASPFGNPASGDNVAVRGLRNARSSNKKSLDYVGDTLQELPANVLAEIETLNDDVGEHPFKEQVTTVLQSLYTAYTNPGIGIKRQLLLMRAPGGYDHHGIVKNLLNDRLADVNAGLQVFNNCLALMGLQDSVTVFTASEFGRTMRANSNNGTDHAWSNHHFVYGSAVQGGFYGGVPDYTIYGKDDPQGWDDGNSQGRMIPQVSTDQYFATLLEWLDIPVDLIPLVLPGLPLFTPATLGFMQ